MSAPAYDHLDAKKATRHQHMKEAGDPARATRAFYELAAMLDSSLRCIVGTDAFRAINGKLDTYRQDIDRFKNLSNSTDVDG